MDRNVIYVVCGPIFYNFFRLSYGSLRAAGYDGKVTVVTDGSVGIIEDGITLIIQKGQDIYRSLKCDINSYTDSEFNLLLDADTYVANPIDRLFELGAYDIALVKDMIPTIAEACGIWSDKFVTVREAEDTAKLCGGATTFYNSGVVAFRRSPKTRSIFEHWLHEWEIYKDDIKAWQERGNNWFGDQMALSRALAKSDASILELPDKFNMRPVSWVKNPGAAKRKGIIIVHFVGKHGKKRWYRFIRKPVIYGLPPDLVGIEVPAEYKS